MSEDEYNKEDWSDDLDDMESDFWEDHCAKAERWEDWSTSGEKWSAEEHDMAVDASIKDELMRVKREIASLPERIKRQRR